ncbi:dihydrolipoyl dehydrogenase [Aureibacillus halotolerans]|uniref:Dihydrolipoyl dehydrogenase n=1 Tax=Aureibacillus halotolerans TaxID=1508390 RepID=A0A4R6U7H9_9BACI|nr:dihydrolipoyl dehydrogenase [Aureibacillus halotolerans]TDQ41632.1 dihydrolipoamide dehydrogenase [Aureibacillus halotolerans]
MIKSYDLIILGGGIAGYTAAIRASQLGLRAALIEKDRVGGTCLHKGCIPTKAFLKSAEVFQQVKNAGHFGVQTAAAALQFSKVRERKDEIVQKLYQGVQSLVKQAKVDSFTGTATFVSNESTTEHHTVIKVNDDQTLEGKHIVIATGSRSRELSTMPFNNDLVLSSDNMVELRELPQSVTIVGGGVIGVEWAAMLADFDIPVTIIEPMDRLLPAEDESISKAMQTSLEAKGVTCWTSVKDIERSNDSAAIRFIHNEEERLVENEKILVAIGREAHTSDLNLDAIGVERDGNVILINDQQQTTVPNIYAAGDCTSGPQLAHKAAWQAKTAVEHIAGLQVEGYALSDIPRCIYTTPQAASVGLTQQQLERKQRPFEAKTYPLQFNGKALIEETTGFAKLLYDPETNDLLGLHLFGDHVTEMIGIGAMSLYVNASTEELAEVILPHPTLSETINEAAKMAIGSPLHI